MKDPRHAVGTALVAAVALMGCTGATAGAAEVAKTANFRTSDGKVLYTTLRGESPLKPRPTIVEVTPYGRADQTANFGPAYNRLTVHSRGTGKSTGQWSAVDSRDQKDVSEVLGWACRQSWSNGHLGLLGFSASAIAVYNSLRLPLPCVDAAAIGAGSNDLYRDLLYPGGIPNLGATLAVGLWVLGPLAQTNFLDRINAIAGILTIGQNWATRPTEDSWWTDHNVKDGPNSFPILAVTGFYDVESRGPFENFKALKKSHPGTKLRVIGGHDGSPSTMPSPFVQYGRWFDHYLLGADNGIDREPAVKMLLSEGGHGAMLDGDVKQVDATDWPVPGTRWQRLFLNPARADSTKSINDGSFSGTPPLNPGTQSYPGETSLALLGTDLNTTATIGELAESPIFAQTNLADSVSLTYTTPPLKTAVDSAGPVALNIWLASTAKETDIHAVLADVWPDGSSFAVAQGRLRTSFPYVDTAKSVFDSRGEMVQPYPIHSSQNFAPAREAREYHVEFWPVGNRFKPGHRMRLYITGTSPLMVAPPVGTNSVSTGPATPTKLLFPVLPGSDMCAAAALGDDCS